MEFKTNISDGVITVTLEGDLDEKSAREAREYLDQTIREKRFESMILDFAQVPFMDSTGIGVLLGRYKRLKAEGIPLCVKGINPQIDKVVRVSGLYQIIKAV